MIDDIWLSLVIWPHIANSGMAPGMGVRKDEERAEV